MWFVETAWQPVPLQHSRKKMLQKSKKMSSLKPLHLTVLLIPAT